MLGGQYFVRSEDVIALSNFQRNNTSTYEEVNNYRIVEVKKEFVFVYLRQIRRRC